MRKNKYKYVYVLRMWVSRKGWRDVAFYEKGNAEQMHKLIADQEEHQANGIKIKVVGRAIPNY